MATYIRPGDFRVKGEKTMLFLGFGTLAVSLSIITVVSGGLVIPIVVAATAVTAVFVWVQQGQLLGGCAKVSDKQFPEIHATAQEAANRLGMRMPEVFIMQDPTLNAFALGFLGKKSVVLHSATVEAMKKSELEYIIGHEFAHIKCGHTNLLVLTSSHRGVYVPIISELLRFVFLFWSRKAEYTCDRGGLLASRDSKAGIAAMCKLAVGPVLFKQMDIDHFLHQQMDLDQNEVAKLSETLATHPYLVKRIHAIQQYFESDNFNRLATKNA